MEAAMPHYRFSYAGDSIGGASTSLSHKFIADDIADANAQRNSYLKSIGGTYIAGSMDVFRQGLWRPVSYSWFDTRERRDLFAIPPLEA